MNINHRFQMIIRYIGLFLVLVSFQAFGKTFPMEDYPLSNVDIQLATTKNVVSHNLLFAEAKAGDQTKPESGSLVIPGESNGEDKDKKQCLNVCKQWGEDCIINPRTGARNCRRTCKEFGEECFNSNI